MYELTLKKYFILNQTLNRTFKIITFFIKQQFIIIYGTKLIKKYTWLLKHLNPKCSNLLQFTLFKTIYIQERK